MKKVLLLWLPVVLLGLYTSHLEGKPIPVPQVSAPVHEAPIVKPVEVDLSFAPEKVIQGEPLLIKVLGLTSTSTITSLTFNKESLPVFMEGETPEALMGLDLRLAPGKYPVTLTLNDGRVMTEDVEVFARKLETAPLGIPESLGGNTAASEQTLVSTLVEEGKIISAIKTTDAKLWQKPFIYPLTGPITITDPYGYSRETGATTLAHKGTDFRAAVGTKVVAINDGKVAYVGFLRNYGNVIAVDHGAHILSIYMHLSRVDVKVGQEVVQGEQIALSGETGYVLGPHLHLTVRINAISIDPLSFLALLGRP